MSAKPHTAHTLCVLTSLHLLPKGTCVDVAMTATLGERERERERESTRERRINWFARCYQDHAYVSLFMFIFVQVPLRSCETTRFFDTCNAAGSLSSWCKLQKTKICSVWVLCSILWILSESLVVMVHLKAKFEKQRFSPLLIRLVLVKSPLFM